MVISGDCFFAFPLASGASGAFSPVVRQKVRFERLAGMLKKKKKRSGIKTICYLSVGLLIEVTLMDMWTVKLVALTNLADFGCYVYEIGVCLDVRYQNTLCSYRQ